jgi:hypothetical protein
MRGDGAHPLVDCVNGTLAVLARLVRDGTSVVSALA